MNSIFGLALSTALFASALSAPPTKADEVRISAPQAGATLHSSDVALSVYYNRLTTNDVEVIVTYVSDDQPDMPYRIVMALSDGDSVTFGLPGNSGTLYKFARNGDAVSVSNKAVGQLSAKSLVIN